MALFNPSVGEILTPQQIEQRKKIAASLAKQATAPRKITHPLQLAAQAFDGFLAGVEERRVADAEAASNSNLATQMANAFGPSFAATPAAPASTPSPSSVPPMAGGASVAKVMPEIKDGIAASAAALKVDPVDLATAISYETGGTFDPTKRGPTTKWGQHRGLIQFGEPQAKQHGVDWANPVASQLGENGAVVSYLRNAGVRPGMGLLDIYSAINAGAPGLYNRSDAAAGGAPGTVRDKVEKQMAGHRAKAMALFGAADMPAPGARPIEAPGDGNGFVIPEGQSPMSGETFDAVTAGRPLDPTFQTAGVSQPWMGTALPPQAASASAAVAQAAPAPMPPPRPAGLAMPNPQADMPAPGAQQAMLQLPVSPVTGMPDLSNENGAGARELMVAEAMMRQGQPSPFAPQTAAPPVPAAPMPAASPVERVAAVMPPQAAPAPASPGVQNVTQAMTAAAAPAAQPAVMPPMAAAGINLIRSGRSAEGIALLTQAQRQAQAEAEYNRPDAVTTRRLDIESKNLGIEQARKNLGRSDAPNSVQEYEYARSQGETRPYTEWRQAQARAGASSVNVGGGSDKQVFDAFAENTKEARAAANGLVALREARAAVQGGAIFGAGADLKLGLQKAAAAFGVGDTAKIQNTETFRSAIAPQVAAVMKATVGSTQISNADREFAEKAAGGSITLDQSSITRLLDIMERASMARLQLHNEQLEAVYPDKEAHKRERALFGVRIPEPPAPAAASTPTAPVGATATNPQTGERIRFNGKTWEKAQ